MFKNVFIALYVAVVNTTTTAPPPAAKLSCVARFLRLGRQLF